MLGLNDLISNLCTMWRSCFWFHNPITSTLTSPSFLLELILTPGNVKIMLVHTSIPFPGQALPLPPPLLHPLPSLEVVMPEGV